MGNPRFTPYADDAAVLTIGDLAVENGTTRIVLHGSLELPRDKAGLARARDLKRTVDAVVRALANGNLPDAADEVPEPTRTTGNPFA